MTDDEMSQEEKDRKEKSGAGQAGSGAEKEASRGAKAGARLKEARQARNVSLDEIARELHLDTETLRDLEANRFARFSAPVFTKGYLRRYAGLVGVPEHEVLADFDDISDADGPPPVVIKPPAARPRYLPSMQAVLLVLLAVLLAGFGWWAFSGAVLKPAQEAADGDGGGIALPANGDATSGVGATVVDEGPVLPAPGTADETFAGQTEDKADDNADDVADEPVADSAGSAGSDPADGPAAAPGAAAAERAAGFAPPVASEVELVLRFTDECWLQVTGGDGERLYAGIARAGQMRRFSAERPVSVVLGNADAVSIEVDGRPYAIDPADRRGRTARITVPGS